LFNDWRWDVLQAGRCTLGLDQLQFHSVGSFGDGGIRYVSLFALACMCRIEWQAL